MYTPSKRVLRAGVLLAALALVAQGSPAIAAPTVFKRDRPDVVAQKLAAAKTVRGKTGAAVKAARRMRKYYPADTTLTAQPATLDLAAPEPGTADGMLPAGDLPMRVGAPKAPALSTRRLRTAVVAGAPAQLRVAVLPIAAVKQLGVSGAVIRLDQLIDPGTDTNVPTAGEHQASSSKPFGLRQISLQVDLSKLGVSGGADWAQRARLVSLPACAAVTPEAPQCQTATPLETSRSADGTTVTALVTLPAAGTRAKAAPSAASRSTAVVAAVSGPSGSSGSFQTGSSAPASRWTAGGSGGEFSWSYPLRVPNVGGGLLPDLALDYSSSAVDGRTTSTNNQSSWVGDGWDLDLGSIERQYVTCSDDTTGNNTSAQEDLCWAGDNATVSFGSHSGELIQDKTDTTIWRLRDDDGTRFQKLTAALDGGSYNKEYWKVTTTDGMQYFFGLGKASASATETTNSALQVPVYGNNSGEPCYQSSGFAASSCQQTYRWNLDHVIDTDGNSVTAYYKKETNYYGHNNNTGTVQYDRASYLTRIDYGQRADHETDKPAAQVAFDVGPRCVQSTSDCASLTSTTAKYWYDVPQDQLCTSTTSCSGRIAPTFFSSVRLTKVRTQYLSGSTPVPVEQWSLTQTYPDPGDGTSPSLWLQNIQHTAGSITVPAATFAGAATANRIAGVPNSREANAPALNKYRINKITTESGGEVDVNYLQPDCSKTSLPSAPETNTHRCFPVYWSDDTSTPPLHWFNKWVVGSVLESDVTGTSSTKITTTYNYLADAAWSYDDDKYTPAKYRTWGQWNGYGKVQTLRGDPASETAQRTDTLYYRGMDGDRLNKTGGTKSVKVTDSEGTQVADDRAFAGDEREEITYNGLHGNEVEASIYDDSVVATTATNSDNISAKIADVTRTRNRTRLSDGSYRRTDETVKYDTSGFETEDEDLGDVSVAADDTCERTTYSRNLPAWILDPVRTSEARATLCSNWPSTPTDDQVLEEARYYYDNKTALGDVTIGRLTREDDAKAINGTGFDFYTDSSTAYDDLGRPTQSTDALGRVGATKYTPNNAPGVETQIQTTSPDPDGSGPLAAHLTTATLDPKWGVSTTTVAPDQSKVQATYDDLGRPTAIWEAGRNTTDTPSLAYSYTLSNHAPSTVTTKSLLPSGGQSSAVSLLDGLMRPRQTQIQALDDGTADGTVSQTAGRLVADVIYDNQGNVAENQGPTLATGSPSTTFAAISQADVPHKTVNSYDGAGRVTKQALVVGGAEKWSTTTQYGGDRVMVTPPAGGTATTTISDAEGRVTELRQHTDGTTTGPYDASTYSYTPSGDLASMSDALGNKWTHKYDLLGREIETNDPDAGETTRTYDLEDQLLTSTDARGKTLGYTYDGLGRQTSVRDTSTTGQLRAEWAYDTVRVGYQTSSTRWLAGQAITSRVTAMDAAGRPTASEVAVPAISGWVEPALANTYKSTMTYNPDGSPKTTILPQVGNLGIEELDYGYDDLGRPNSLGGEGAYIAGTLYSGYNDLLQTAAGLSGKTNWVTTDVDQGTGRTTRLRFDRESVAKSDYDISYGYNNAGAITKIAAAQPQSGGATDTQCFKLDYLQRLTSAWTPGSGDCSATPTAASVGGPAPYWKDWTFDRASNRTKEVKHTTAGDTTTTWILPAQGAAAVRPHGATQQLVTAPSGTTTSTNISYDAAGNVTGRSSTAAAVLRSSAQSETLDYDSEGLLATALTTGSSPTTTTFAYDPDGEQLIRRDGATTTLYLGSTELKLTRSTSSVAATRYYEFDGQTVAVRTGDNTEDASSLWSELNNTASWQLDWKTNTISSKRTMPYGEPRDSMPPTPASVRGDHGFVDGTEDPALGFVNLGVRNYDPASGRFLTVDPLIDLGDPQQWSPYGYGNGNPIIHPDPSGLIACVCGGGGNWWTGGGSSSGSSSSQAGSVTGHGGGGSGHSHSGGGSSSGKSHKKKKKSHKKKHHHHHHHDGKAPSFTKEYDAARKQMAMAAPSFNPLLDDIFQPIPLTPGAPVDEDFEKKACAAASEEDEDAQEAEGCRYGEPEFDPPLMTPGIGVFGSKDVTHQSIIANNKIRGDKFRDETAQGLASDGYNIVGKEVSVSTPFGRRQIDILAERNGHLVNFETKYGSSRYLTSQRLKDWYIQHFGVDLGDGQSTKFPTVVVRGPL